MTHAAGLWPENAALRERLPALSSVIRHIGARLDLDTVLAELARRFSRTFQEAPTWATYS